MLLYKGESGKVVALKDRCCHRGAPLSLGRREGDCVRCMYHGLKFDPTGKCIQIPGQDNIPAKLGVRSYPVVEQDHLVWIWMGDPELADPDEIIDFPYLRDPQWKGMPGLPALRRQLAADRRQPERLRAPGLRAHQDAGRIGGVRLRDQAGRHGAAAARLPGRTLAHERAAAAVPPKVHQGEKDQTSTGATSATCTSRASSSSSMFSPAGSGAENGNREGTRNTATASS